MLIRRADEMEGKPVDMAGARDVSMRLMIGREDGAPSFAMRHFRVAPGGHTPRHSHNYEHEVYVLTGRGRVESGGAHHDIRAGDVLLVDSESVHQFVNCGEDPLEFLCLVPIEFDCGDGVLAPTPGSSCHE